MVEHFLGVLRFALIDLRGDLRRFAILITCLALGVGTIASVGAVGASLQTALSRDARAMLGGDLEARLSYRPATAAERTLFDSLGRVSATVDFVARPSAGDASAFAMVRAVDPAYPLLGAVDHSGDAPVATLLESRDGVPGTLPAQGLLDRLGLHVGDTLDIESKPYAIRGVLRTLPDQTSQGITIGFPVLISTASLADGDQREAGALSRYRYRILLAPGTTFDAAADRIRTAFPSAGWQLSGPRQATDEIGQYFELFSRFLLIVGLSALLVGGIGVANAVSAYVGERQAAIATLKSLGATRGRVLAHFLVQVGLMSGVGIAIGLVLAAVLTLVGLPLLAPYVDFPLSPGLDWPSLGEAAIFGIVIGFTFAYPALYQAQLTEPAILFRSAGLSRRRRLTLPQLLAPAYAVPMLLAVTGMVAMAIAVTGSVLLVASYGLGVIAAFAVFELASRLLRRALRVVPPLPDARLRNAIKAIYRPGTPAPAIMLSLGLGMALLVLISTMVNDLRHQLDPEVRVDAPNFVYMDLFDDELAALSAFAAADGRIERFTSYPVLRSASLSINGGAPVKLDQITRDISMFFGDEQPLSEAAELPGGTQIVAGQWWAATYSGPPLLSVSEQMQQALGLKLGDRMTFLVSGEEITATVDNIRRYDWQKGRINFPLLLSPGTFDNFPLAWFAFVKVTQGTEVEVERDLDARFPDLVYIPVEEALTSVYRLLEGISNAVSIVGSISVASGLLVLAGALVSRRRQREQDSVIAKVLGATRGDVIIGYLIEYGLVGAIAAFIATVLGIAGAWAFSAIVLETRFSIDPLLLLLVDGSAILVTIVVGAATTWSALSASPAQHLREE